VDLLERARILAASPLLAGLPASVLVRLAANARVHTLAAGAPCPTGDAVWIVADGEVELDGAIASAGAAIGLVGLCAGLVAERAPAIGHARGAATVLALAADEVRDLLEEDPRATAALADALATALLVPTGRDHAAPVAPSKAGAPR
jgi:CRP-like cAMP-binding protein